MIAGTAVLNDRFEPERQHRCLDGQRCPAQRPSRSSASMKRASGAHSAAELSGGRGEETWCMRGKGDAQNSYSQSYSPILMSVFEGISDKICSL
jgi:hypothetical protein